MKKIGLLFACLCSSVASAMPLSFNFSQGGFDEGATITGMFTGEDLDNNGQLVSFAGEITGFMLTFSGNSLVSSFSLDFSNLDGLVYDLDGGPLGDGFTLAVEGIAAGLSPFNYEAGPGPTSNAGIVSSGGNDSITTELVSVSAKSVPEPATLALLSLGLAGVTVLRKKQAA